MTRQILVVAALAVALTAHADVRAWKDKKGVTHFGEAPESPRKAKGKAQPRITMYTTSWCPVCKALREYLNGRGIAFRDYDVEKDQAAAERYHRAGGTGTVPLAIVGDKVVTGFNAKLYDTLIPR